MAGSVKGLSPEEIVSSIHGERVVLQDFCALADSIEWELGQHYLRERGNKAFISDSEPVPYAVNNDGNLSLNAATVLFASLEAAERAGTLEQDIFVLEIGIGVGLFARLFLDAFHSLCQKGGKDYYDRLCYVAGDNSRQMLLDVCRHGVLAEHAGRCLLRPVDALFPERGILEDAAFSERANRPLRAVFLNYLLDCLPACVLRTAGDELQQLCVRTCLARGAERRDFGSATAEELAWLANSADPALRRELMMFSDFLASEYAYRPVDLATVPYGDFAVQFARSSGNRSVLHNHGAIQCLERLLDLVTDEGFILINDYGSMQSAGSEDFQHQRYSGATFVGINFPLLKAYCGNRDSSWIEPAEEDASIHARLLGRQLAPGTVACFHERFSSTALQNLHEPVEMARNCVKSGRFEAALTAYQRALELQPQNWLLMNEVANFLTFPLRSPAAGLKMARAGLARNPNCSAELWNTLGDSLFTLGSVEDARRAYLRALRVNREDVRARYNLAYVYTQTSQHALALKMIGEALWLDTAGTFREGLLHRQSEILTWLTQGHQEHYLRTVNRVSIHQQPGPAKGRNALTGREVAIGPNQQQSTHIISNQPSKSGAIQLAQ